MRKKTLLLILVLVLALAGAWMLYTRYAAETKVATLNFPDFTVEKMRRANDNTFVKIESVPIEKVNKIHRYDMILVRVHGSDLSPECVEAVKTAKAKGVPVFATGSEDSVFHSLDSASRRYLSDLFDNASNRNYRSLFNYIRHKIDGKKFFNHAYEAVVEVPSDYFFHVGEDEFFATYEDYQRFYEQKGWYKPSAPRVVLLSGNINMQNSNEEHIAALVRSLEEKGLNVYPIFSFGEKKLDMISAVKPNLIINRPHGRLLMGGGTRGTDSLRKWGVPMLSPVTVSELYDRWKESAQGMSGGGLSAMSVVLPELDGAVAPYAVAAQFERNGMKIFDAIPRHTEKFCRLVKHYTDLQRLPNAEKKIAIYYYKGTGKGAVNASGLEGVPSLYNLLRCLKENGYKVDGLPASAQELEKRIAESGVVLGPYAAGAYDHFLKHGRPALVSGKEFTSWMQAECPPAMQDSLLLQYGAFPGKYMAAPSAQGEKAVAVARLQFGNVVILPQPMASAGEDVDKIIHGSGRVPAYPYVASYLWSRKAFGAHAILHFGTHGSLEFIPGKQLALSDEDWTDALIGDVPHFYLYTIGNIGEGLIAKRRSYATLLSHLTAPFMQGELYGDLYRLRDDISRFRGLDAGDLKKRYAESITSLSRRLGLLSALSIDTAHVLTLEEIERVHHQVEEIESAKVNDGLYVWGQPYSEEQIRNTARLCAQTPASGGPMPRPIGARRGEMKRADKGVTASQMQESLRQSPSCEKQALLTALSGGYVAPSSAGDPVVNPSAVPTGKNFYGINPETVPSEQAWQIGWALADELLATEKKRLGRYPEKVSFTLWATDFVSTEGAMIAQIFYLLGVEPLRDGFGNIRRLRLISPGELGRDRIDVVVQTSGQFRDLAASRLALIHEAVAMAAAAEDSGSVKNHVKEGMAAAERYLLSQGYSPVNARRYASERIFGGVNGNYGTSVMGFVEKGDAWDSTGEIASRYIHGMSGLYSADGGEGWGESRKEVFEAALLRTETVVQPRASNTWGPLSLDHVYEFMGGISAAVTQVTGREPSAYFSDFRNPRRARVQELKEAIGVETHSTMLNPKYISHLLQGGSSALSVFAETLRNTYGWSAMRGSAIDQQLWNDYYEIYVQDRYKLGMEKIFADKNPYALQEVTAVMLESARKGLWQANETQIKTVAALHGRLVANHAAACSEFVCDNAALKAYIASHLEKKASAAYRDKIAQALSPTIENRHQKGTQVLKKVGEEASEDEASAATTNAAAEHATRRTLYGVLSALVAAGLLVGVYLYRRRGRGSSSANRPTSLSEP